ncbi:MAG: hypothetical protein J0I31_03155 [Rhizobiales bacterium]|nr:hypothetical protein [Hyphomicrobiales bacterium]
MNAVPNIGAARDALSQIENEILIVEGLAKTILRLANTMDEDLSVVIHALGMCIAHKVELISGEREMACEALLSRPLSSDQGKGV